MGKVLFINGSPNEHGCVAAAMEEVIAVLRDHGVETEMLWLGRAAMPDCMACMRCQETGACVFQDQVNEIGRRIDEFAGIVIGSPVYYGGANGRITSFLDRLFFSVPDQKFAGKLGAAIVSCRRGGASAAFERLNQYFLIENMTVVGSQYWNQVHGSTPEEVRRDAEGMQTMRTLGQNLAWMLRALEQGDAGGVRRPVYEERVYTNFI